MWECGGERRVVEDVRAARVNIMGGGENICATVCRGIATCVPFGRSSHITAALCNELIFKLTQSHFVSD